MVKKIINRIKYVFSMRGIILLAIFAMMSAALIRRLFDLQIVNGSTYAENFRILTTATRSIRSSRGNIYDRDGVLLAYNELSNSITLEDNGSYETTRQKALYLNGEIYYIIHTLRENGDVPSHDFHIIMDDSGNYVFDSDNETTLARFRADVFGYRTIDELKEEEAAATPEEIVELLASEERFAIYNSEKPYTEEELAANGLPVQLTRQEVLDIVIVRYQLSLVSFQRYMPVTVASDVSEKTIAILMEHQDRLTGMNIAEDYVRRYNEEYAEVMAPLIGYTGRPSSEELEALQAVNEKYSSTSIIGKSGLEQTMELYLQGSDGSEDVTIDNLGKVVAELPNTYEAPRQGNDIYLTVSAEVQQACYDILEERIAGILLVNLEDLKTVSVEELKDIDTIPVLSYDIYSQMFNNNVIDYDHFTAEDATQEEKYIQYKLEESIANVLSYLEQQLNSGYPVQYSRMTKEQQAYFDYMIETFLTQNKEIIDPTNIDSFNETYQAYEKDGSISPKEYLTFCVNNNWIDVTRLPESDEAYLTSDEIFQAIIDYTKEEMVKEESFVKLVFKYMLQGDVILPKDVLIVMYDQGILNKEDGYYSQLIAPNSQISAFEVLQEKMNTLEISPAMIALDPCSGSVVLTDPDDGSVIACVTYPGYDNNRLANEMDVDYYYEINVDQSTPFYNKATQQLSAPGSTYKMVMAVAGLNEGLLQPDTIINCSGRFGVDLGFLSDSDRVHCWLTSGHGMLTVSQAIQESCNVFFCSVGFGLGLDSDGNYSQTRALQKEQSYSYVFGLDEHSGIQLPESEPHVTDDLPIPSAIGQGTHQYTTTQLARYVSTVANRGECPILTLVEKVEDSEGNLVENFTGQVLKTTKFDDYIWENVYRGMYDVMDTDTVFGTFPHDVIVYGKTGTAQESTVRSDHALTVGFTKMPVKGEPLDVIGPRKSVAAREAAAASEDDTDQENPAGTPEASGTGNVSSSSGETSIREKRVSRPEEIAFACRVGNGYTSRNTNVIMSDVLDYYYELSDVSKVIVGHANQTMIVKLTHGD